MAANTGRTHPKYITVHIGNSGGVLTQLIGIDKVPPIGLDIESLDLTALADAVRGGLPGIPDLALTLTGIFNTTDHGTLTGIDGAMTPRSFDVRIGVRQAYQAGEPQFGITNSATSGVLVKNYKTDGNTYSFDLYMYPGSSAPAWGTAAEA